MPGEESIIPPDLRRKLKIESNGTPQLSPKHTGRVLIRDESGIEHLSEGAQFSNIDLGWYTSNYEPHPLFEKYKSCQFSLKFRLSDNDRFGEEHIYGNLLLSPFRLGEMGPTDWRRIPEAERLEAEHGIIFGAFSGFDDPRLQHLLTASSASFVAFAGPNTSVLELEPFIAFMSFAFHYDDQVDNSNVFANQLNFQQTSEVTKKLIEVLRGEKDPEEQKASFDFPQLTPLCRYLEYLRNSLKERAATDEIFNRFVADMISYLNAVALGTSEDWMSFTANPTNAGVTHRTHWELRRLDSGGLITFEVQLLSNRNKLSREIYEGHLWTEFRQLCTTHITLVNDLMSHKKEMWDKETCNAVYDRHVLERRGFVEAMDSCVEDANNAVKDINELEKLMLELYHNDEDLKEAIYLMKACLLGHMHWYNYAVRYHNGIVFDCVVHANLCD